MSTESAAGNNEQNAGQKKAEVDGRSKRNWVVWIAIVCLVSGSASYLLSQRAMDPASGKKGRKGGGGAVPVSVDTVKVGNIGVFINAIGTVTPVYTVTVTSRVAGELVAVRYREGQLVHRGDLLAEIDPRPYQAALTQAEGQLARDRALLKNAYIDLNRYKGIFSEHAIPEQTVATQQALVEQDEGIVKLDQGTVDAARVNVDYSKIIAPISGRVGLRSVDPGNIVQANGTTGLLTIAQLQPITVIFTIAEDYVSEVVKEMRTGNKLRVDALDRDDQTKLAQGTMLTIDNAIDVATGTVRIRANFTNQDYKLFPNEFVNARLLVRTLTNVNLIPSAAIQRNSDIAYVYVVKPDKTVQSRNIRLLTTDVNTAAATGVELGETVVTNGFDKLQDGVRVTVQGGDEGPTSTEGAAPPEPGDASAAQPQHGDNTTHVNTDQPSTPQTPQSGARRK